MKNILQSGDGEQLLVLTDLVTIKVSARDTANQYAVFQETVPRWPGLRHTDTPKWRYST
jgi:hypothetical protein